MNRLGLCALTVAAASLAAHADVVTFNNDPLGPTPGGFQSVDSSIVTFSTQSGGLFVGWTIEENASPALSTSNPNSGGLLLYFSAWQNTLSLDFGYDTPGLAPDGSLAVLTLYQGPWQVAQFTVPMNLNDLMDQTITGSYEGGFNRATFHYASTSGVGLNMMEVVDNVTFTPTPGAAALAGVYGVAGLLRRRR